MAPTPQTPAVPRPRRRMSFVVYGQGPVRWFAENQPVDAIRALLAQQPVGASVWIALAWCAGILVVAWVAAVALFRRSGR